MTSFEELFNKWEENNPIINKDSYKTNNRDKIKDNSITVIDLHGFTKNESMQKIKAIFNQINPSKNNKIKIIHGVGRHSKDKRVLKDFIREWLINNSKIDFFRPGHPGEGGPGVTIVYLKKN